MQTGSRTAARSVGRHSLCLRSKGRFEAKVLADSGRLMPGVWQLDDALISAPGEKATRVETYLIAANVTPDNLAETFLTPESAPFWSLPRLRRETALAGLDSTNFSLQFQTLLARPLLLVAMVLIAAAFSLRFFRFGGIGRMVGGGLGAGFVLYLLTKMVADLGASGLLSASVAAWSPAVVGSMLGALALLHREDGRRGGVLAPRIAWSLRAPGDVGRANAGAWRGASAQP